MKKILTIIAAVLTVATASAQFSEGKTYVGGSLTGLDFSYNGSKELSLGINAKGGYFIADNLMLFGEAGYTHPGKHMDDYLSIGAGGRYYITQNGIFLGANVKYRHANSNYNDFMPGVEVGYAFFISRTVTIEPSIYYQQSFKRHSDYSTIGLSVGVGIYLGKD